MPPCAHRNKEGLAKGGLVFQQFLDQLGLVFEMGEVLLAQLLALAVELVGQALQKEHPEDEFLELRSVHLAAQDIRGFEEEGFELGEGDLFSGQDGVLNMIMFVRSIYSRAVSSGPWDIIIKVRKMN